MESGRQESPRVGYGVALAMLVLAFLFPIALMIFNPTLMFERGWEQYAGTAIYLWAVSTLARELRQLWRNERAFAEAPRLLQDLGRMLTRRGTDPLAASQVSPAWLAGDDRLLPRRVRQLVGYLQEAGSPSVAQLMELNREASGLDQEQTAGRFTLTRYILYLLPVIGFIGTVEGISKALMNISLVLPLVNNLDAFLNNLTGVTSALQIAFDSTLLALFLSASLMLVQTLIYRRAEELLARVDRWVVEHVLPGVGQRDSVADQVAEVVGPAFERLRGELAELLAPAALALRLEAERIGHNLAAPVAQLGTALQHLPGSMAEFRAGVESLSRAGGSLESLGTAGDSLRRGLATLSRIESALAASASPDPQLEEIRQGLERATQAIESLAASWASAYERSSRTTQEQLARTLHSLRDALELINVSIEQGNSLYRNIVKKLFDERGSLPPARSDGALAA